MRRATFFAVQLGVLFALALPGWCQDQEGTSQLEEINREVRLKSEELAEIQDHKGHLEKELKDLRAGVNRLKNQEGDLQRELTANQSEREDLSRRIESTEDKIEQIENFSRRRMRALYLYRSENVFERVLKVSHSANVTRDALFLKRIEEFDKQQLKLLKELIEQHKNQTERLENLLHTQEELRIKVKQQRSTIEGKLNQQQGIVQGLKTQEAKLEVLLATLRAQALRVETVMASLTGKLVGQGALSTTRIPGPRSVGATNTVVSRTVATQFFGKGLKGSPDLVLPVQGLVLERYGKEREGGFENMVRNKGVHFHVQPGSQVYAIERGLVIYTGVMPGYGTVLVLDHGKRNYSVYGRLLKLLVQSGDMVSAGQAVGELGEADERGQNFYFEIRENGRPVDPHRFFPHLYG